MTSVPFAVTIETFLVVLGLGGVFVALLLFLTRRRVPRGSRRRCPFCGEDTSPVWILRGVKRDEGAARAAASTILLGYFGNLIAALAFWKIRSGDNKSFLFKCKACGETLKTRKRFPSECYVDETAPDWVDQVEEDPFAQQRASSPPPKEDGIDWSQIDK